MFLSTKSCNTLFSYTESALMKKLRQMDKETQESRGDSSVAGTDPDFSMFKAMKLEKPSEKDELHKPVRPKKATPTRVQTPEQQAFLEEMRRKRQKSRVEKLKAAYTPIDLFKAEKPLDIFSDSDAKETTEVPLKVWPLMAKREMNILKTQAPRNLLEDIAAMTEKGMVWHFPINNEQGIEEEEVHI